jgi:predicted metalloprotease
MLKLLTRISIALTIFATQTSSIATAAPKKVTNTKPLATKQLPYKEVIDAMYLGIKEIERDRGTPSLYVVKAGAAGSACGQVSSTIYCPADNSIYITDRDIEMAYRYGDATLAYIVAHEYAHAMQVHYNFMPQDGAMSELQADCLAGYYVGAVKTLRFDRSDLKKIESIARFLGDYEFESSQHHGTPKQRSAAVFAGFRSHLHKQNSKVCQENLLPKAIQEAVQKSPNR